MCSFCITIVVTVLETGTLLYTLLRFSFKKKAYTHREWPYALRLHLTSQTFVQRCRENIPFDSNFGMIHDGPFSILLVVLLYKVTLCKVALLCKVTLCKVTLLCKVTFCKVTLLCKVTLCKVALLCKVTLLCKVALFCKVTLLCKVTLFCKVAKLKRKGRLTPCCAVHILSLHYAHENISYKVVGDHQ